MERLLQFQEHQTETKEWFSSVGLFHKQQQQKLSPKPLTDFSYWSELYHMPTSKPATSKGDERPVLGVEQSRSVPMESTTFPDCMPHGGCILFKLRACCVVSLDCHNNYHRQAGLNNSNLFFIILEAEIQGSGWELFGRQTVAFSLSSPGLS